MYRASADIRLPTSIIGSLPRPTWFTENLGSRSFLEAMVDTQYREQYEDAVSVYLQAQNNAGINIAKRKLEEMSLENWDLVLNTNATGAYNLVHSVLPHMRARSEGHVVSICSTAGTYASPIAGMAYSASKHAMAVMTKFIDYEESADGIRASIISPGEINTPILDTRPVKVSDEHKARILQPEDIGEAVLYVASQPPNVCVTEMVIKPLGQGLI